MRVFFIRHGDPDYARDTLTEIGHQQAQALARKLSETRLERLYVSPMGRAQATARYIAETQQLQRVTLDWMRELNGNWVGNRWAWNMPGAETLDTDALPQVSDWHERVPYGPLMLPQWQELAEHFDDLMPEFGYVREGHRYRVRCSYPGAIACVAHAGAILTLLSHLLHWPLPLLYIHLGCDPTSVTELRWEEHDGYAVPRAIRINDTSHWTG
jgi:broad specificity phosphatase PhoE